MASEASVSPHRSVSVTLNEHPDDARRRDLARQVRSWSVEAFHDAMVEADITRAFVVFENGHFTLSHPKLLRPVRAFFELSHDFADHEGIFLGREPGRRLYHFVLNQFLLRLGAPAFVPFLGDVGAQNDEEGSEDVAYLLSHRLVDTHQVSPFPVHELVKESGPHHSLIAKICGFLIGHDPKRCEVDNPYRVCTGDVDLELENYSYVAHDPFNYGTALR